MRVSAWIRHPLWERSVWTYTYELASSKASAESALSAGPVQKICRTIWSGRVDSSPFFKSSNHPFFPSFFLPFFLSSFLPPYPPSWTPARCRFSYSDLLGTYFARCQLSHFGHFLTLQSSKSRSQNKPKWLPKSIPKWKLIKIIILPGAKPQKICSRVGRDVHSHESASFKMLFEKFQTNHKNYSNTSLNTIQIVPLKDLH